MLISLILVIKEVPQSGYMDMDILRCKYAQIFQKYIEKCFALRCHFDTTDNILFFLHLNKR